MDRNKAIEIVKSYYHANKQLVDALEFLIPELKESVDEKIRKWLLDFVQGLPDEGLDFNFYNLSKEQVVAWLEKQGQTFTKKDVDDAYLKGICDAKRELAKQGNLQQGKSAIEAINDVPIDNANKVEPKFKKD